MATPHVLAVPYPAQGHVIPLMEVSLRLVKHGIKVTFVNTEFNHKRIVEALSETENAQEKESVNLVSIPDGMEPWEDRNELGKLSEAIMNVMPGKLEDLIEKINEADEDKIMCVIASYGMGWALEIAKKWGIRRVSFFTAAAATLSLNVNCPKLIDDGIIDSDGLLQDCVVNCAALKIKEELEERGVLWEDLQEINCVKSQDWSSCAHSRRTILQRRAMTSVSVHILGGLLHTSDRRSESLCHQLYW